MKKYNCYLVSIVVATLLINCSLLGQISSGKLLLKNYRLNNTEGGDISQTPAREKVWVKWFRIYKENMLSKGIYHGELYDIGFDFRKHMQYKREI